MNNNSWFKKEMPLQTVIGFGGGATGFGAHSSALSKLYVDDVFSTQVYIGNSSARNITNGINLSGKGGLVWAKTRSNDYHHNWFDTVRTNGRTYSLASSSNIAAGNYGTDGITSFNSNGFSLGTDTQGMLNDNNKTYTAWTFRKAKGFCDIVTYTGNGSNTWLNHSLGSVPGMMIVKCTSTTQDWAVWHRNLATASEYSAGYTSGDYYLKLNSGNARSSIDTDVWDRYDPTATQFRVGDSDLTNKNSETYVAYLFAGGDSQNIDITSKTVTNLGGSFNASYPMSWMTDGIATTNNTNFGYVSNADGMIDVYVDLTSSHVITNYKIAPQGDASANECYNIPTKFEVYGTNDTSSWTLITTSEVGYAGWRAGVYQHFAIPLTSGYRYWRIKVLENKNTDGTNGGGSGISEWKMDGYSASSESNEYKFGENEDQNLISCGSYTGNGNAAGPEFVLGWEPSWVMIKNTSSSGSGWMMYDSMRGWFNDGGNDRYIMANEINAETTFDLGHPTSRGFEITTDNSSFNASGSNYVYMAIRRPDGYVGKPPAAGTDAFAMDTGNSSSTIPTFDSGIPVDFALLKRPAAVSNFLAQSRLSGDNYLLTNGTQAEVSHSAFISWDSNAGWAKQWDNLRFSWMWKRGAGFDVVAYKGNGTVGREIPHNLSQIPEMIWVKNRSLTQSWPVYHKGLNGGTTPWEYYIYLNGTSQQVDDTQFWNDTAPTSTHVTTGGSTENNHSGSDHLMMLFASANDEEGNPISKVGYYDGQNSELTITTGFQPRFVILKRVNYAYAVDWHVLDTLRGWGSGTDQYLALQSNQAQAGHDFGAPTSTGFTLTTDAAYNGAGGQYIYYAHA